MSKRGRRRGYKNFSIPEQLLLCEILDDIRPLGKDMWERSPSSTTTDDLGGPVSVTMSP
ncbi:hypothetical protein DVH05_008599 [Phytophthora capsici]|nr:hypothetical protein DVH05_008599 [Phytophthora capsici]